MVAQMCVRMLGKIFAQIAAYVRARQCGTLIVDVFAR